MIQMNNLIRTFTQKDGTVAVDGRDLHKLLEVTTPYRKWFPRMMEYGFAEGIDFVTVGQKSPIANGGYQTIENHALSLDMAKELSMIQRTEKGKQARQYFIAMAKKSIKIPTTPRELAKLALSANEETNERLDDVEKDIKALRDDQVLTPGEYNYIGRRASRQVNEYAKVHSFITNSKQRSLLFKDINWSINEVAGTKTRSQLRAKDFDMVDELISNWQPSTVTVQIIVRITDTTKD